ncbi:methyl-accepting chemotaxis protein [Escherichia coli]|nr:methyl-accepting chemotaxis protein [Escherichia coli]
MKINFYLLKKHKENNLSNESPTSVLNENSMDYKISHIISKKIIMGVVTIEEIRDSILENTKQLQRERDFFYELHKSCLKAKEKTMSFHEYIVKLQDNDILLREDVSKLKNILLCVDECISSIKKLSQHTNLIAINAAIEAAHVGKLGKGFGTISQEIRKLSSEIQKNLISITNANVRIEKLIDNSTSSAYTQSGTIDVIIRDINTISGLIKFIIHSSSRMSSFMDIICDIQFLNVVKIDHFIWKFSVYDIILNKNTDNQVTSHNLCRLGEWFYKNKNGKYKNINGFLEIEKPHKDLHEAGKSAIDEFRMGNIEKMTQALDNMENFSNDIISHIHIMSNHLIDGYSNSEESYIE